MPQHSFGSGFLYGIPSGANPTPQLFGTLQEVMLDVSYSTKKLHGQLQFPVAIGRGMASMTGKAKAASISSRAFNALFNGLASVAGGLLVTNAEPFAPAAGTYTVTNATGFADDLGVTYAASGISLVRVAAAPSVGQYSVNTTTGVYTFNVGDNTVAMFVSYSRTTATGTVAQSTIVTNQPMGASPVFSMVFNVPYSAGNGGLGTSLTFRLYQVQSMKLSFGFKNEDFTVPEFDFEAFANNAGQVYQLTTEP
jgi:hypothetical protein